MTDLANLTILEAGEGLRSGQFSAVDLLEASHTRAAITEAHLHAYLTLDHDGARSAAVAADAAFSRGQDMGPLHGIPVAWVLNRIRGKYHCLFKSPRCRSVGS